ncbi:MAG: CoA-binding protein [Deltaproteobacteria bacterium]|nr:CoA-binding protein [Deltaproteobacteria bacterium]
MNIYKCFVSFELQVDVVMSELVKNLVSPDSVALIGVSRNTGQGSLNLLDVLVRFRYKGRIYPVNPSADRIMGMPVYKNVCELPESPDLAVIMVNRKLVPGIVYDCAEKGIKTAIIISDGFAESDTFGKRLQEDLLKAVRETNIRLLGPNSMGVVNAYAPFTSSFVDLPRHRVPIAFIGQSGLFVQGFSGLEIGKGIDIGNGCDIGFSELLEGFIDDADIRVIAVHVEELKDIKSFSEVMKRRGYEKPVIVYKTGRSGQAREAALAHSGSLAGNYDIYKAFFKSLNLIVCESTEELADTTRILSRISIPKGRKVGIITPTGGGGIACIDACDQYGFKVARLSESSVKKILEIYPPYYRPNNPVDIMSAAFRHGYGRVYRHVLETMAADEAVDILFCINGMPTLKTIRSIISEHNISKPVLSWVIGSYNQEEVDALTDGIPLAAFPTPERAFRALDLCCR